MVITGYRLVPWLLKHLHCNQSSFDIGVCIRFNLGNVIGSADNCTFEISWDSVLLGGKMLTKLSPVSHILTSLEHMATNTFIFFMSDVSSHTFLGNVPSVFFSHRSGWKSSPVWKLPSCYTQPVISREEEERQHLWLPTILLVHHTNGSLINQGCRTKTWEPFPPDSPEQWQK